MQQADGRDRYWALVCAPATWAIDDFLRSGEVEDEWGVDRHAKNQIKDFDKGQLAVVRVGVDSRNKKLRHGNPRLQPGIYGLCEILSEVYPGAGGSGKYSYGKEVHPKDWPTVRVRYLRSYLKNPLLIDYLKREAPDLDRRFLMGPRTSSIPLSPEHFRKILSYLNESEDTLRLPSFDTLIRADEAREREVRQLASTELLQRARGGGQMEPERRLATIFYYARDAYVAAAAKHLANGVCDFCKTPAPFKKPDGTPFLECHHVKTLAEGGSDTLDNTVALCPNCHRRLHILSSDSDKVRLRDRIKQRSSDIV